MPQCFSKTTVLQLKEKSQVSEHSPCISFVKQTDCWCLGLIMMLKQTIIW